MAIEQRDFDTFEVDYDEFVAEDPLGAARGCFFGMVIGMMFWGVIIFVLFKTL